MSGTHSKSGRPPWTGRPGLRPRPALVGGRYLRRRWFLGRQRCRHAQLTGELLSRPLLDITFSGGVHSLVGPWAEIRDFEGPFTGLFTQASSDFSSTRSPQLFEAANTYYIIDTYACGT